jgi:hypothetical protein
MDSIDDIKLILDKLPLDITEIILENSLIANEKNIQVNKKQRDIILNIFKNDYKRIKLEDETYILISSLLYKNKKEKILKCLYLDNIERGWQVCSSNIEEKYELAVEEQIEKLQDNKYNGFYGLYNKDKFCVKFPDVKSNDARTKNVGVECGKGSKKTSRPNMIKLMFDIFKVPIPSPMNLIKNNKDIWNNIEKFKNNKSKIMDNILSNKYVKKNYSEKEIEELDIDELKRLYYWSNQKVIEMCQLLKEFLEKENLLIQDSTCGKQSKDRGKSKVKNKKEKEDDDDE